MTIMQQITNLLSEREQAILLPEIEGPFWIEDCEPEVSGCEGVDAR